PEWPAGGQRITRRVALRRQDCRPRSGPSHAGRDLPSGSRGSQAGCGGAFLAVEDKPSHLLLLLGVRWKLFVNSFRRQGRDFEVIVQLVGLVALGAFVLATSAGFYFGAVAALGNGQVWVLNLLLWAIFLVWQLGPVFFDGYSPGLSFREIARYPVSFPLYCFLNSIYGLLDPAALTSLLWLLAIWAGILLERPAWALLAAVLFLVFVVFN